MHMLYNSDSYAVVHFELPPEALPAGIESAESLPPAAGYEIVDKMAGKEAFISGALAASFKSGVEALIESGPSEEAIDEFLEGFTALMQQPLVLH
jgi:hypothetical protein